MTPSGAITPGQSGPGSNGNEWVLCIPQSSKARALPSDCWMSYIRHWFGVGSYPLSRDAVGVFYSPSWLGCSTPQAAVLQIVEVGSILLRLPEIWMYGWRESDSVFSVVNILKKVSVNEDQMKKLQWDAVAHIRKDKVRCAHWKIPFVLLLMLNLPSELVSKAGKYEVFSSLSGPFFDKL